MTWNMQERGRDLDEVLERAYRARARKRATRMIKGIIVLAAEISGPLLLIVLFTA